MRSEPAVLIVTIVHGTFPRGPWLQLRRNLCVLWTFLKGFVLDLFLVECRQLGEAELWPSPAAQPDRRWWFESGSEFERDLLRRSRLPPGSVIFDRFLWSGRNTFADRAKAARSLRAALRDSVRNHPGVPHVLLAHSHGGTVAVKALDTREESRGGGETPQVGALLTLGTPFVRLVWRWAEMYKVVEHRFAVRAAMLLPPTLLMLAPVLALNVALVSNGIVKAVAVVLGICALVAWWRLSLIWATLIIAIIVRLQGLEWSFLLFWAGVCLLAVGGVYARGPLGWRIFSGLFFGVAFLLGLVRRPLEEGQYFVQGKRHVEDGSLCLPCPVLALRAPRDEASLIIGLGQVVQGLWHIAERLFFEPLRQLRVAWRGRAVENLPGTGDAGRRWRKALRASAFLLVVVLVLVPAFCLLGVIIYHFVEVSYSGPDPPKITWGMRFFFLGITPLIGVLLVAVLTWVLPAMAISLVTGREAFMLPAVTVVDAEPLPNARASDGLRPAAMALEILYDAHPVGLNHSLYDAPEVRERIAIWLRDQAGAPAVKREAEEDWG